MHTKTHLTVRLTGCAVVEQKQRYSCIRVPCKKFSFGPSVVLCVLCGCVAQLSSWIHPPHLIGGLNCFAVLYHSRQRYVEQASVPRIQVKLSVLVCEYCTIPAESKSGFLYSDNTASPEAKAYQALPKPLKACCTLPQSAVEQN